MAIPSLVVEMAFGGSTTVDPAGGYLVLDTGPALGTGTLGAIGWVDVSADVNSVTIHRGQASEIETATPGTATVVLDNWSGAYDPLNINFVTNATFEKDLTGWVPTGSTPPTLAQSATQVHAGHYAMQVTWPTASSGLYGPAYIVHGLTVGATYTWSVWVYVNAGPNVATGVGGVAFGGSTSGTGSWQRITQTWAATVSDHYLYLTPVAATTSGQQIYVDDVQCVTGSVATPNVAKPYTVDVGQPVQIIAVNAGATFPRYRGFVESVTTDAGLNPLVTISCTDGLANLGRAKLAPVGSAFAGDSPSARLVRILNSAMWPTSMRSLDTGVTTLAATTMGDWALSLAQAVTDTELGILFCDGAGNITFYDRLHVYTATRSITVQATIDDSGGGVDMLELTTSKDRAFLFNQAQITRTGGSGPMVTDDTASEAKYGLQTYPGSAGTLLQTDADALSLGSWLVGRYKTPAVRITTVKVDAITQNMWATLLPLTIYDRIRVLRRYLTSVAGQETTTTIDVQLLIEGLTEEITPDSWVFTLNTRATDNFKPFILGSTPSGTIGVNTLA